MEGETRGSGSRLSDIKCHHSLHLCGDRMKMSLPKKKKFFFLGRLSLLPGSHLGQNFGP